MAARPDRCKPVVEVGPGHSFPQTAQGLVRAALFQTDRRRLDGEPQLFRVGEASRASSPASSTTSAASQRILGDIEAAVRRISRTVSSGSRSAVHSQARSRRCARSNAARRASISATVRFSGMTGWLSASRSIAQGMFATTVTGY